MKTETPPVVGRVSDLHRSAFWIYGVTAMVMRAPLESTIRHAASAGLSDWQVRLEVLRLMVVLVMMTRLFLAAGLYFDRVYVRPDSAEIYPRRSYALDFVAWLMELLLLVAVSTTVSLHVRTAGGLAVYSALAAVSLIYENFWLVLSRTREFSTVSRVASSARWNNLAVGALLGGYLIARMAGADAVFSDQVGLILLLGVTLYDVSGLISKFEQ